MNDAGVSVVAATAEHGPGLSRLFSRAESPCFCRFWHFEGDKNAWLDRAANARHESEREMRAALEAGSPEMQGAVALGDGEVVGWMKLAPATTLPKLYAQRLYKGLPVLGGERSDVWTVGCFLIDAAWRGRGAAHALVAGGIEIARAHGARALEAFPRRAEGVSGEELWTGPFSVFASAGFEVIHDFAPYPVMRRELGR